MMLDVRIVVILEVDMEYGGDIVTEGSNRKALECW